MKHISLFSGIGGFDLAAQWAGWDNLASCEINPFGRRVLSHYWPHAYHHDDIKTLTGSIVEYEAQKRYGSDWRADGVILSGGFPCQPYSLAGKRLGKEDERHLWPEMCRIIREIKPDWIVGENVLGLANWSDGLVFNEVQTDLETAGYEVQAFVLPACAADAPHRRDRVWIVAYHISSGIAAKPNRREMYIEKGGRVQYGPDTVSEGRTTPNANGNGQKRSNGKYEVNASKRGKYAQRDTIEGAEYGDTAYAEQQGREGANGPTWSIRSKQGAWDNWPTTEPVFRAGNDGVSAGLDGITFPKWRNESIKAAGNAIVPQIAYRIFETINDFTQHNKHGTQFEQANQQARARARE